MRVETHFFIDRVYTDRYNKNKYTGRYRETEGYAYGNKREDTFLCGGAVLSERV